MVPTGSHNEDEDGTTDGSQCGKGGEIWSSKDGNRVTFKGGKSGSSKTTGQNKTSHSTRRVDIPSIEESVGGQRQKNVGDEGGKAGRGKGSKDGVGEGSLGGYYEIQCGDHNVFGFDEER